ALDLAGDPAVVHGVAGVGHALAQLAGGGGGVGVLARLGAARRHDQLIVHRNHALGGGGDLAGGGLGGQAVGAAFQGHHAVLGGHSDVEALGALVIEQPGLDAGGDGGVVDHLAELAAVIGGGGGKGGAEAQGQGGSEQGRFHEVHAVLLQRLLGG